MPRITRIHFAGLGHQDARFPALTLDLRDGAGRAADSVIWAENGTGKSSLLSLFFSTYRPSQRLFLGKQAESKARELGDYLRDRDLGFIITEWDTTDDRAEASLLPDGPRELLLVGQALSWRNLDGNTGDLQRLFFTLRPGRDVHFTSMPILGLAAPATSFAAFREWLDAQQKSNPRLEIVHTTNQTEWRDHLEQNHLDPELFNFQLRMNEREGGINNLFNELKRDADFIHEFLKLGFDPATAAEVRANLDAFLPKLRRREALELQLEFNQKLLVDLDLFVQQVVVWEAAKERGEQAEREAAALWAGLIATKTRFDSEATQLQSRLQELDGEKTRLESARTLNGRRQNFFHRLKAQLEVGEAEAEQKLCEQKRMNAHRDKRLIEMAMVLAELRSVSAEIVELERALERERTQAKPVLEALQSLGAACKFKLEQAAVVVKTSQKAVQQQRFDLAAAIRTLRDARTNLVTEQSTKEQEKKNLEAHFDARETHRDRLRNDGWLEAREAASEAHARWQIKCSTAREAEQNAARLLQNLRSEETTLVQTATRLASDVTAATERVNQLNLQISAAGGEEERLATHEQIRAAVEVARADLNLPQTAERLAERSVLLLRQILRLNVEGAEDQRAQASVDRQRLFPPHRDIEALVEKLQSVGIRSATTAAQWLAYNFTDPQPAADLLASDPARFGGVLFDETSDGPRLREALVALRTEQLPVVVAPTPDAVTHASGSAPERSVVLPRHAAGFNFAVARAEMDKLASVIAARAQELETLHNQLDATKTVRDDLSRWLAEFGGTKLGTLREKLRGAQQTLTSLQEQQRENDARRHEVAKEIVSATTAEASARQEYQRATTAVGQLETFIERFDSDYESKRARQIELGARLQAIAVELPELESRLTQKEGEDQPLLTRLTELGVAVAGFSKEIGDLAYVGPAPKSVGESLEQLRTRYKAECQQYEGRFLNSKAQGELAAKQSSQRSIEQELAGDFVGLDQSAAEARLLLGDLPGQMLTAESALTTAQLAEGAAGLAFKEARKRFKDLGAAGEQERPGQLGSIPTTSTEAATELAALEAESVEIQRLVEANRQATQSAGSAKSRNSQRSSDYGNLADRLRDQNVSQGISPIELADDDAQVRAHTEDALQRLRRTRTESATEHDKLSRFHIRISDLTQEDRFARAMDLPARSLFAHMSLDELILVASDKEKSVKEETLVLQADLDQMNQHRETLVESLLNVCDQATRLLHRAEKWSVLPENMGEWSSEPFLRIRLRLSPNRADNLGRLKALVDMLFAEGRIPPAIDLVFRSLTALVGETGIDATILKPETQRRRLRYPVREMGSWSEGERTTVAILLYCTLVKIRAQSRGHAGRRAEVSALLLDNPVGPCSKPEFLQMHRWIASQLGVQLIYATGINDPAALSVFPNRIRLAKNRLISATGELAVGLESSSEESLIQDIRIFDGNGENDLGPPAASEP